MAASIALHEQAHLEYIAAYHWYETQQTGLGDQFMSAVDQCLTKISKHPEYCSILRANYRQARVPGFPFTVVFEHFPNRQLIHVAAVHHTKKHPKNRFRKAK